MEALGSKGAKISATEPPSDCFASLLRPVLCDTWRRVPPFSSRGPLQPFARAAKVGHPRPARAVGTVMNRNRIPIVLPCHRVVGASGDLTGYAGGLDVKRTLLELEGARV